MLCRMAFKLSGEVVDLQFDNSTAKVYLCNQGGTVSPFLSRLACYILNLANKHGTTLIPAYIPNHPNVEAIILGNIGPRVESSSHFPSSFPPLESTRGGPVGFLTYQSMSALLHSGKTYLQELGVESVEVQGELYISFTCINSSSAVQVSSGSSHTSIQTSYISVTMLDGGVWLPKALKCWKIFLIGVPL